jgi:hypothetical protein
MAWDREWRKFYLEHMDEIDVVKSNSNNGKTGAGSKDVMFEPVSRMKSNNNNPGLAEFMRRLGDTGMRSILDVTGRFSIEAQINGWSPDISARRAWNARIKGADTYRAAVTHYLNSPSEINDPTMKPLGKVLEAAGHLPDEEIREMYPYWVGGVIEFLKFHNNETFGSYGMKDIGWATIDGIINNVRAAAWIGKEEGRKMKNEYMAPLLIREPAILAQMADKKGALSAFMQTLLLSLLPTGKDFS